VSPGKNKIDLFLLRLDKIHPDISGNKWFKLKFYLDDAAAQGKKSIVTFGGAWSNHIIAVAAACKLNNLQSTGIIRGEKPKKLSWTLKMASGYGMQLLFITREDYKRKKIPAALSSDDNNNYIINEGGYGEKGALGAAAIADYYQEKQYTHICCAAGTGTMMAGLIKAASPGQQIIGMSVLKNNADLQKETETLLSADERGKNYTFIHDYHFGGYAKKNQLLTDFMNRFYRQTAIPTDFVYTAKLLYGIYDLAEKNFFPPDSKLLIIHSGGLQGNNSLAMGTLIF
jgi:1-aminocyclopropane-1-carboxylate deaminase/D-cysteine desulfhydrase-like pyridoxal-dependent ACC family enzyme